MKKHVPLILALALAMPAFAGGEIGLLLDRQLGKAQTVAAGQQIHSGNYDSVSPSGMGFRVGASFLDIGIMALGVNATYHPKSEEDLKFNGAKVGKFGAEYLAVGAGLDWKLLVNLHAGVEIRRERFTGDLIPPPPGTGVLSGTVTTTRPWMKFGIGFSVPLPVVSPFVRLEFAVPTTKNDKTGTPDDLRQALAPQYQVALYGGLRF
jgi:hypothetical protein